MKRSELFQYRTGLYWFQIGEGNETEWVIGRLLQSRLTETHDGKKLSYTKIRDLSGPIRKSHFKKKQQKLPPNQDQRRAG